MKLVFDTYMPPGAEKDVPPVILLHGRLDSRVTWKKLAPEIAEKTGRKVYALDARNHGESPWSDDMNFEILAKDLENFMDEHNIRKAILVGHSMGGRTAITLALQKPDKVEKVFVEDMVVENYSEKSKQTVLQMLKLLRKSLSAVPPNADEATAKKSVLEFIKSVLPPHMGSQMMLYGVDNLPLKRVGNGYAWQANLDVLEDMLMNKSAQVFSGVYNGDALFLHGDKSFFDVKNDESIAKYFPKATKVCVEGAGHLIHHNYPEEFMREVLKFIGV